MWIFHDKCNYVEIWRYCFLVLCYFAQILSVQKTTVLDLIPRIGITERCLTQWHYISKVCVTQRERCLTLLLWSLFQWHRLQRCSVRQRSWCVTQSHTSWTLSDTTSLKSVSHIRNVVWHYISKVCVTHQERCLTLHLWSLCHTSGTLYDTTSLKSVSHIRNVVWHYIYEVCVTQRERSLTLHLWSMCHTKGT